MPGKFMAAKAVYEQARFGTWHLYNKNSATTSNLRRVTSVALSSSPETALKRARKWPHPVKGYASYVEMIAAQARLQAAQRLDHIVIVTPNNVHFDPALLALKAKIQSCVKNHYATICAMPGSLQLWSLKPVFHSQWHILILDTGRANTKINERPLNCAAKFEMTVPLALHCPFI